MEFGISLPGRGPLAKPDQVLRIAAKADALGYASMLLKLGNTASATLSLSEMAEALCARGRESIQIPSRTLGARPAGAGTGREGSR